MNIAVKNLQTKISIPRSKITTAALKVCRFLHLNKNEISVAFVGARRMQSLNKTYLGHDYVTDVITFDLQKNAEIIICPLVAQKNAKENSFKVEQEIVLYVIHGLLHLAGYNDHKPSDIKTMRAMEQQLLNRLK